MNQSSNYNVWVFRLIYILGICGAIVNFTAEEPQLEIENRRESSPAIYVAELEQELKELFENTDFNSLCNSAESELSKLDRFGEFSTDVKLGDKASSIEVDSLRRCKGKTTKAHRQMETICFKFNIDRNLVDEKSFLFDENHFIELNYIPTNFTNKFNISCKSKINMAFYEGSIAMVSIYWNTKGQLQRRNLAFYSKAQPKKTEHLSH